MKAPYLTGLCLALALTLSGCAKELTGGVGGSFCETARPIRLSAAAVDKLTEEQVKAALSHNEYGQKECGWQTKKR